MITLTARWKSGFEISGSFDDEEVDLARQVARRYAEDSQLESVVATKDGEIVFEVVKGQVERSEA